MLVILFWLKNWHQSNSLKLMIELEILTIRIFLVNVALKIDQKIYLLIILCWKIILGYIKLKI